MEMDQTPIVLFSKEDALEILFITVRDWLVSTELPHFIKQDEDSDKPIGRFYLYLLDDIGY